MSARSYHDHNASFYPPSLTPSTTTTRRTLDSTILGVILGQPHVYAPAIMISGYLLDRNKHTVCHRPESVFTTSPTARDEVHYHAVPSYHLAVQHEQHECRGSGIVSAYAAYMPLVHSEPEQPCLQICQQHAASLERRLTGYLVAYTDLHVFFEPAHRMRRNHIHHASPAHTSLVLALGFLLER